MMRATATSCYLCLAVLTATAVAQPPTPTLQTGVIRLIGAGRIVLTDGTLANIAPEAAIVGADGQPRTLDDMHPGDMVELLRLDATTVVKLTIVPQLRKRWPMSKLRLAAGKTIPCTWRHDGRELANSFRTASATLPVSGSQGVEATVAYEPQGGKAEKVAFRAIGVDGELQRVLWEQDVGPGEAVAFGCPVLGLEQVILQCLRPDGTPAEDAECVWGDPSLVLRVLDSAPIPPELAPEIARRLSEALGGEDPGPIAVGTPAVVGLNDSMAQDVRAACVKALGERFELADPPTGGAMLPPLGNGLPEAPEVAKAESILNIGVRYAPPGLAVSLRLVSVEGGEELARLDVQSSAIEPHRP